MPLKEEITYGDLIRILEDDLNKLKRALEIYICEYVEKIDIIEKSPDIDKEEIVSAMEARNPVESIYKEEGNSNDDKNISLINKIPACENEENEIINKITVSQLIKDLESKERPFILLRFYKNKTQTEVGKILRNIASPSF